MEIVKRDNREPFEFMLEGDDTVYKLPPFKRIPFRLVVNALKAKTNEEVVIVLMDYVDEHCPGFIDKADMDQAIYVVNAWKDSSGLTSGE